MSEKVCSVEGCEARSVARGWCMKHYQRWRAHGDAEKVLQVKIFGAAEQRFWPRVDKAGGCWLWTGGVSTSGYGRFRVDGVQQAAHRVAYELSVGPIPEGMEIDHTCHTPLCVNPAHLRTATRKQNNENAPGARRNSKSGIRGVSWMPERKKWRATIGHNGKTIHLGLFADPGEAEAVVIAKRNELFTHNILDRVS